MAARETIAALAITLALAAPAAADRPDTPGSTELFTYEASDVVDVHGSPGGAFLLHFTRAGIHAVPSADTDDSGVPDHVERLAILYDEVLAFYTDELGFRAPLEDDAVGENGGDGRFDVYLLDFGGGSDGAFRADSCQASGTCVGFMVQENDFAGYGYPSVDYANRVLASHELFHAVQAAYGGEHGSVLSEGTAVWATEAFDPTLSDFEAFVDGFLDNTDRPIDRGLTGPVDPFSYGAGLFFRFLEERYARAIVRGLFEATEATPWLAALDALLASEHGASFAEAFTAFSTWNLYTGLTADPSVAYAEGETYPPVGASLVPLPFATSAPPRLFYASAHYWRADPGTRITTEAALVGDVEGLALVLAVRRGDAIEIATDAVAGTAGADEVFVVVVNPALEGESRRPGVCVGSPDEVDACRAAMTAIDAGAPDEDAGVVEVPDAGGDTTEAGCGCAIARPPTGAPIGLALAAVALVATRRRRVAASR